MQGGWLLEGRLIVFKLGISLALAGAGPRSAG